MKKIILYIIAIFCINCAWAQHNGLLWRVTGNGLEKPSYILGSHHLAPESMIEDIPGLTKAIEEVEVVCGELDDDAMNINPMKLMTKAMAPADSTLAVLLTPDEYAKVDSIVNNLIGKGSLRLLGAMKPSIITNTMSLSLIQNQYPQMGASPFDKLVMERFKIADKPIVGLEDIDMQIDLLFGAPIDKQVKDLLKFVDNVDSLALETQHLTEAYLTQDLDEIGEMFLKDIDESEDLDAMVFDRNRRWIPLMEKQMAEKSTLFVVGAAHLCGKDGVLQLLRDKGYTVEGE